MNTPVGITAASAVTSTSAVEENPLKGQVKAAMRAMMPTLVATIVAVLEKEDLKGRAYILSDLPGAFTGDRMAQNMLARRVEAAGMKQAMGRLTGKIRAEFARPLQDEFDGVEVPQGEEEESLANDTGL